MGKSNDRNATIEQEFASLEKVLNQTADDATRCLKLLKKNLSDYDSRHSNHFINTAASYMRSDMRTAKDTATDLKHVAHQINKSSHPSESEITSARNIMGATAKAMDVLNTTARNYDQKNGRSKGVKGAIDNVTGNNDKEKHEKEGGLFNKDDKYKDDKHTGLFGKTDKDRDEKHTGLFGKTDKDRDDKHTGLFGKTDKDRDEKHTGLFGKTDKDRDEKHTGLFGKTDKEKETKGTGLFGKSDDKENKDSKVSGLFGKNEKDKDDKHTGLFNKGDKDDNKHGGGLFGGKTDHRHGGGILGNSDTVEDLVKSTLRENFNLSALSHQITIAEKSLSSSPSFVERAKEAVHEVKEKLKGDKSSPTHDHHARKHTLTP